MNNISKLKKEQCTGCSTCYNICPVNAINMKADENGFIHPIVDTKKCIDCGLCIKKCPQLNTYNNPFTPTFYAAQCKKSIRLDCSSGGIFKSLALKFLKHNGYVCGAAFNDDFSYLRHIIIEDKKDLYKILKSKYLQSDITLVLPQIKNLLEQNKNVLFCGTPCQVAGLKSYLNKNYSNLLTIDILCHGVPSPKAYNKFIEEINPNNIPIKNVDFRDKKYGWGTLISVLFNNNSTHYDYYNGYYFKAFLNGYNMRESCFSCNYSNTNRIGDITLGDFWGIKEINNNYDDGQGTSMIICNNPKGKNAILAIEKDFDLFEKIDTISAIDLSKRTNAALVRPTYKPFMRDCFFYHLNKGDSFSKSLRYAETSLMDVGIVGWWNETKRSNYGSTLTNYALFSYLHSLGLSVAFIAPKNFDRKYAGEFNKKYRYRITAKYTTEEGLTENNKYIDTFIVASDVLWYYNAFIQNGYFFMLDFVNNNKKKISYSTSFGNTKSFFPDNEIPKASMLLKKFDHIGVRELEGESICKNKFSVNATQVLDPVFIANDDAWTILENNATRKTEQPFMFSYMLDPTQEKVESLEKIARLLKLKLVTVTDKQFNKENKEALLEKHGLLKDASIEEVIYHIKNANFVITDSYHGMCFSLIFRRNFIALINRARGASRFETLGSLFNINDRMIEDLSTIEKHSKILKDIDYSTISKYIEAETDRSRKWLKNAIYSKKEEKPITDFDILYSEITRLKDMIAELNQKIDSFEK